MVPLQHMNGSFTHENYAHSYKKQHMHMCLVFYLFLVLTHSPVDFPNLLVNMDDL